MTQSKCMGNFITNKKYPDFHAKLLKHETTRLYLKLKKSKSSDLLDWKCDSQRKNTNKFDQVNCFSKIFMKLV